MPSERYGWLSASWTHDGVDVVIVVILSHLDVSASGFELDRYHLAETFFGCCKCLIDDVCNVISTAKSVSEHDQGVTSIIHIVSKSYCGVVQRQHSPSPSK